MVVALLAAFIVILMRSLSARETRTTMLGFLVLYIIGFNGVAMLVTGARTPTLQEAAILLVAGIFAATGNILLLRATRFAPANQLASTHYSQIVWAVVLGALFFQEEPDLLAILGLAIIGSSGLLTVARERIRLGTVRWNPFSRNRL